MPSLFSRFFRHIPRPEARAVLVSLSVGVLMLGVKFLAYYYTRSAAILSDALEGIVNIAAAGFATFALSTAHRPADVDHPYGHGKIEFLSAAFEGGMIILAALLIFGESVLEIWRIHQGAHTVARLEAGAFLVAVAMAVHGLLGGYLIQAGKRVESMTIEADGWHLLSDAASSAAALVALLVVKMTGWLYADPIGALVIGLYITHTGYKLLRRSAAGLMDEQDFSDQKLLIGILDAQGAEDLFVSQAAPSPQRPLSLGRFSSDGAQHLGHPARPRRRQHNRIRNRTSPPQRQRHRPHRTLPGQRLRQLRHPRRPPHLPRIAAGPKGRAFSIHYRSPDPANTPDSIQHGTTSIFWNFNFS